MGETSRENCSEESAAKFLSNSKSDNCCRKKKQTASVSLSPLWIFWAELGVSGVVRRAEPSLIFGDFNVIFSWAGGVFSSSGGNGSCRENLIFYSVCCSIQSGNASSLGRLSKEHQIIAYQLDYVIVRIGFLFGEFPKPKRVRVWPSMKHSKRQKPDGISVFEHFCLDQWLMASLNYSPSLSLTISLWLFCFLPDSWLLKVCVRPSITRFHFHFFIKVE